MQPSLRLSRGSAGRLLVPALFTVLFIAAPAAQPGAWAPLDGPHAAGLRIAAVADDGTLFAATYTEVFRYDGAAWSAVTSAVNGSIHDVATASGGRVWVGTSGALRSLDGGLTWEWFSIRTMPHSGTNPSVFHVAVGPDGTVYAGKYRTPDNGASWPEMSIYSFATAFLGATVYAGTLDGIHRSTSSGAAWTPSGLQGTDVHSLAVTGTRLVAATEAGLWVSDDGTTWTPAAFPAQVRELAVAGDGAVWAAAPDGLYRSPDGQTWPPAPTAFAGRDVRDVAASGTTMLAVVDGNPFRSSDGGAAWVEVHDGLGFPYAAAALASGGVIAVAASGAGPFTSADGGATWALWTDGLAGPSVQQLLADPAGSRAFARTPLTAYRAALPAGTWTPIPLPDDRAPVGLAADGTGWLFALSSEEGFEGWVYRSDDEGGTWVLARTEADAFEPLLAAGGGVVAVEGIGFFEPPRLLVSADGGATWTVHPHPFNPSFGDSPPLFVDDAGRIYVADGPRLHRSEDLGATWTVLGPAGSESNRIEALRADAEALCLGTLVGVWCSTDDGATFDPASIGLPTRPGGPVPVVALVRDGARYVALTADDGAFVSGVVVSGVPGPPTPETLALAVAPNPLRDRAAVTLTLDAPQAVRVEVFDALGRRVALLHDGLLEAGAHALALDGAVLPSGVYAIRATGPRGSRVTRQLVVVH